MEPNFMAELFLKDEVFRVVGAAIEVHRELGHGFLEAVYQEALEHELAERMIPYQSQVPLSIKYKERMLAKTYIPDLICFGSLIVEVNAVTKIGGIEEAQVLNYLKATEKKVGLLLNFGNCGKLDWKRIVR